MSIVIIANVVLSAAVIGTIVTLLSWSVATQGRGHRTARAAAWVKLPLLVVVSTGCLAALAVPAEAAGTGAISGTVTTNTVSPAPIMSVCVEVLDASNGSQVGFTTTNASGQYTVSGLAVGPIKVHFKDCTGKGYLDQYYDNKTTFASANAVPVTAGATTTGIGAKMVLGAKIKGTVTNNAAVPVPLGKMCVEAMSAPGLVTSSAMTTALGNYTLRALPTGSYKIQFSDCAGTDYIVQYYNNHFSYSAGNSVSVIASTVTSGINAKMVLGGKITGTVTNNAANPAPLGNICVSVLTSTGSFITGVTTPANGQYSIAGIPVGSKKVGFFDCAGGDYVPQYYNNKPSLASANNVPVAAGATNTAISAKMVPAGKISGTVTNTTATPLAHICVDVLNANTGSVITNATTNSNGTYTIGGLAAGSYKVEFLDCGQQGYIAQYYKNQVDFAAANPVSLTSGVTTTGISAQLAHS